MFFYSLVLLHSVSYDPYLFNDCCVVYLQVFSHLVQCSRFSRISALPSKSIVMKRSVKFLRALYDPVSEYFHQQAERQGAEVRMREWKGTENRKRDEKVSEQDRGIRMSMKKKKREEGYYTWLLAPSESI